MAQDDNSNRRESTESNRDRDDDDNERERRTSRDDDADRPSRERDDFPRERDARDERGAGDRDTRREGRSDDDRATRDRDRNDDEGRDARDRHESDGDDQGIKFSEDTERGLTVGELEQESLAYRAGLRRDDRIVSINGRAFNDQRQFHEFLRGQAGRRVPIIIDRGGRHYTVAINMPRQDYTARQEEQSGPWLGVSLAEDEREEDGARVTRVYPAGPAARAGFRAGDVITEVNGESVKDASDFIDMMDELEPRRRVRFTVQRNDRDVDLTATLADRQAYVWQQYNADQNQQFTNERESGQRYASQRAGYDEGDDLPPFAMSLEHDRRMAEQHQRMEQAIRELRDEVRQLREAIENK